MQRKTKQNLVKNVEEMEGKLSGIQTCQQKDNNNIKEIFYGKRRYFEIL